MGTTWGNTARASGRRGVGDRAEGDMAYRMRPRCSEDASSVSGGISVNPVSEQKLQIASTRLLHRALEITVGHRAAGMPARIGLDAAPERVLAQFAAQVVEEQSALGVLHRAP